MICPECNGRGEVIYYVETDRDENTVTVEQRKGICPTCNGSGEKPQTNADRIRAMSDEELADFITSQNRGICTDICREMYYQSNLKWLKQPAWGNDSD